MKLVFLLASLAILTGCSQHAPAKHDAPAQAPIAVSLASVQSSPWPVFYEASGSVRATTSALISSKIMGAARDVRFQIGDRVSQGQLLITLDARDLDASLAQAKAAELEARNAIAEADASIASAQSQLQLAQVTFRRMDDLFNKRSISHQEFDEANAKLQAAQAAVTMARARRSQVDARIAQATQSVESAQVAKSYSEVHAPFAGIITEKRIEPGQMATPGMPLLLLERSGSYRLEASIDESLASQIRLGQPVDILLDSAPDAVSTRISEIVPAIDPNSRAFLAKADLPAATNLRSGMFGRLRIPRESRTALTVPAAAIVTRGSLQSVFVNDNNIARARMVTLGGQHDQQVEVLSGLRDNESIIINPSPALRDGSRIEIRSTEVKRPTEVKQ